MSRVISPFLPTLTLVSYSFLPLPLFTYPLKSSCGTAGKLYYAKYIQIGLTPGSRTNMDLHIIVNGNQRRHGSSTLTYENLLPCLLTKCQGKGEGRRVAVTIILF